MTQQLFQFQFLCQFLIRANVIKLNFRIEQILYFIFVMNPLLNRIYQNKNKSKSKYPQVNMANPKDRISSLDKVLVPKLNMKVKLQVIGDLPSDKQKTAILKPYIGKLPTFHTQKRIQNKSRGQFRSRRLSSTIKQEHSLYFPTELNFDNDIQKTLAQQNHKERIVEMKQKKQQLLTEEKKFHKINQNQQQKNKKENQLFQYLNVLQTNPDLHEEFCYMNRDQKPYSFYIVDYQERNRQEYLTVSLRGITYFKQEDDEFFTIQQLSKDVQKYRQVAQISFFDNYIKQKVINHWKIAMVRKKFLSKCQFLKGHLLNQNDIMQRYIKFLHNIYEDFVKGNFVGFKINSTSSGLQEIVHHMEQKQKNISDQFKFLEKQIRIQLLQANTESMTVFRREQRITLGTNDKLQKDQSFLPYDNKKKSMKFTQLAKLKEYQQILYHLIKYTDLVRFNLKIQHVKNTLAQGINQMNLMYNRYLNRSKLTFISWLQCKINIVCPQISSINASGVKSKNQVSSNMFSKRKIQMIPSIQIIKQTFMEHQKKCVQLIYRNHELLISRKNDFLCTQYDFNDEITTSLDMKMNIQKEPNIVLLRVQFQKSLDKVLNQVQKHIQLIQGTLLRIYNESFLQKQIQYYLQNDPLKEYLQNYEKQKQVIQKSEEIIEYGLIVLKVQEFKFQVKRKYQEKYKTITTAIPAQVNKRCEQLSKQVKQVYSQFKENPQTIRQYLNFVKRYYDQKGKMFLIEKRIEELLELQAMVNKNGIKLSQSSKTHISQCQTFYRQLQKRFLQIQQNEDKNKKHFQILVDSIIPKIEQKSEEILKDLQTSSIITNPSSQQETTQKKLQQFSEDYKKLKLKKQELFQYQDQLNLGHKDLENYFKFQVKLGWFLKIWKNKKELSSFQQIVKEKGYAQINDLSVSTLIQFQSDLEAAAMDIQAVELLQEFKSQLNKTLYIIKLSKLMGTQTFQPQHCEQIKKLIVTNSKKIKSILFTIEGGKTITCEELFQNSNIKQIQNQIAQIAFLSAQQSIIKKQLGQIQEYWKKNKIKFINLDVIGNGTQTLHLDQNQTLYEKLGLFLLTLRSIEGSSHASGQVLQRLQTQKKITQYLQRLLLKWSDVQKQWLKLLPLMTNSPSVKHQSNVYFQFTGVDNTMKKLVKQISDMSSMRKVIEDYQETKFIQTLQKCGRQLKDINKVLLQFLQNKRTTYNRFYFLTDEELITIIQNVKDARSFSNFAGLCFNCIKITLQNQLISGFQNTHEIFKLRKAILRGEPDEMFKSISENMKTSMKYAVRALVPKMKIATNIEQQLKENCLQVCILSDSIIWTQMSETYLNVTSYDELQLLIKGPHEQMSRLLPKIGKQYWLKLSIRLMNAMHLKDIGQELIRDQVTKNDFKWKQQMKYSLEQDQINIRQFDKKLVHGLEYYPPQKITVPTLSTTRFLYQTYYACLTNKLMLINGAQGQGKRNLVKYGAMRFGNYHKELVCNSNLSIQYILRFVQGALLAGAWLSFYQYSNLKPSVTYELLQNIQKFKQSQKLHIRTMFVFVNHGSQVQKISMFKFNNYAVVEPQHKKICEYLLQMYKFKDWEQLTTKIISFLKTIKPFLQTVMGSQMSLIRRIVDGAGVRKFNGKLGQNQNLMVVQTIRKQIIDKSSEHINTIFVKALSSYFNVDEVIVDQNKKYIQKLDILKYLLSQEDVKNLVVIGDRSCKSTLIDEAIKGLGKKSARIYPQAVEQFFTQFSIQYLNSLQDNQILIYDGNNIISEFNDLITCGYLLIADRKVIIRQKVIMEMRNIQQCSPSFIQKCQIVYLGNLVSKLSVFLKYCPIQNFGESELYLIMSQLFGEQLQKLQNGLVQITGKFINRYKNISQSKTIHKILVWFMAVLGDQSLWQKNYSGKFTDYTVHDQYLQLVPTDTNKLSPQKFNNTQFLIAPTKSSIMVSQLALCLMKSNLQILLFGPGQIGKTSLINLIKGMKINLSVYKSLSYWSDVFKKKLICVRKQAKNYLMSINQTSYRVIVDDLDLGTTHHCEYLRYLIDCQQIRDRKYVEFFPNHFQVLCTSRKSKFANKLIDRFVTIPLQAMSKQSISTIFHTNIQNFVRTNGTNKQVQDYLQRTVLKSFLIIYDDLQKVFSPNMAGQQILTILRNIISIPKKNSFISVQDFQSLFKSMFYNNLTEKSFNKKMKWQLNFFYENIAKVCFDNKVQRQLWINDQKIYKEISQEKVIKLITDKFQHLIVFKSMIENVLAINNQLNCLYSNIAVIGRKGVGKKHIIKAAAFICNVQIVQKLSQAILLSMKNIDCILLDSLKSQQMTKFEIINQCLLDEELQKFLQISQKQQFRAMLMNKDSNQSNQSTQAIQKIKKHVKNILIVQKEAYLKICERYRQINNFSVCVIQEWPAEAIISVYKTQDQYSQVHAQIFTSSNSVLVENGSHALSMKKYQRYINLYTEIYNKKNNKWKQQLDNYTKIYDKFNQSCSIIRHWQSRVEILREQITESIEDLSKSIEVNKMQSFVMSVLTKQLHQKEAFTIQKNAELEKAKKEQESQLNTTKKIMQKIQKIIGSLNRTQMSQLKKIYKSNKIVTFGLQCVCILFGEQVSQKSVHKLLADSNLLMKMKGTQILNNRNHYFQAKFKKQSPLLEESLKVGTTQTARILIDWIKAILQYWQTTQVYNLRLTQYKKLKNIYENSVKQYQKLSSDLKSIQERAINLNKRLDELQKKKIQTEKELIMVSTKIQNSAEIIPILLNAEEQIQKNVRKKKIQLNNLIGNSILLSFCAVYLPLKRLTLKQKLLEVVKKHLKQNFIALSQTFIGDITESKIDNYQSSESKLNSLEDMNLFLLEQCSGSKLIIDPQRKVKNYLEDLGKQELKESIIQNLQEVKQFAQNRVYITSSESYAKEITDEQILVIDWKIVALNPQEKLFNKIAFAKKRQYFQKKHELNDQIQKNLKNLDDMKIQLYNKICKEQIKILQDDKFIEIGKDLVKRQNQTKQIQKRMNEIIEQIQDLSILIYKEVNQIFIILGHFKLIRPIGLDLILDAASKQGDSIQNVISWVLANLEQKHRLGWLIAVTYSFNSIEGENLSFLINELILQTPLKDNQIKIKKPSLISISNWQKMLKLSTYTTCFKNMFENIQKHPKQFENWVYDSSTIIPKTILPQNISFIQQLFFIMHFKQKLFPTSIQNALQRHLPYEIVPYSNMQVIQNSNQIFPIISHVSIQKIEYLSSQLNQSKHVKIRIGSIQKDSQMRNAIWKAMQNEEWMIFYGITDKSDVQWIQNIIYYTMNYRTEHKLRIVIQLDARIAKNQANKDQILLNRSKYLSSIGVHIYEEQTTFIELYQNLKLTKQKQNNLQTQTIQNNSSVMVSQHIQRNLSLMTQGIQQNKNELQIPSSNIQFNRTFSIPTSSPRSPKTPNQIYTALLHKLHKQIILAHKVILKKYPQFNSNSRGILNRIMELLSYIQENSLPIQFNVQSITLYIEKIYSCTCIQQKRKGIQELVERVIDESKFNDKTFFGVGLFNDQNFNIDKQIQNNNHLIGCDQSYNIRNSTKKLKDALSTLDLLFSPQNIKDLAIQIRTIFSRLPILLSNKQISNQNYRYVFQKEQGQHNKKIIEAKQFFNWVDVYANKDQIGENIQADMVFDWENLLSRFSILICSSERVKRNEILQQLSKFINNLKLQHEYLLYLNTSVSSFSLNGAFINNFSIFMSSYLVNYLSHNNIRDGFLYVPIFQFKKTTNQNEVFANEGLILAHLNYRDFRLNTQLKTIDASLQIDGEQKAPVIIFKMKKRTFSIKQQEQLLVKLKIKHSSDNREIYSLDFGCNGVYLEWNLRQGCLFTQ